VNLFRSAVWVKIQADLLNRRLASALVLLTILASSALLTLTLTTLTNMDAAFERSFDELRGAHLWLFFDRDLTGRSAVRRIEALPGVAASTGLQYSVEARVRSGDQKALTSLRRVEPGTAAVNALRITAGRGFTPQDAEQRREAVVVDKRLAAQWKVQPGDTIWVDTGDEESPLLVIGLAYNPTWDIYRTQQPPYLYLLDGVFEELFTDEESWDWSLGLRLADPQAVDEALAAAEGIARSGAITAHTDWRDVRDAALFNTQLTTALLMAFGLFALGASAFILTNSISGAVLAQFRDIGVLKALGFSAANITTVYLGQNLALGALGGLLGVAAGAALAPIPLQSLARALDAPPQIVIQPLLLAAAWLAVQAVIFFSTLFPALSGARTNTIQAISSGYELPNTRPSLPARIALWLRLPLPLALGAKNAFARRGRAAMTLLSLALGVISLVFSALLNHVLDGYLQDPSLAGVIYQAQVTRQDLSDRSARRILARAPGVSGVLAHASAQAKTPAGDEFSLHAEEGDFSAFPFRIEEGRIIDPRAHGEVMIGVGLKNWLGLKVGDRLTVTVNERPDPVTWRIVGVYREPSDNGQMAVVNLRTLQAADPQAEAESYLLRLASGASEARLRAYLKAEAGEDLALSMLNPGASSLVQFRAALMALSVVLSFIALLSVVNSAVLTTREMAAEIGIYKTLGMTPAQVTQMVLASGALLGAIAGLVGAPLGLLLARVLLTALGSSLGFGSFDIQPGWASLALPALAAVLVGLAGSVLPARWAANLRVVEVLGYE